jgi:hypothetical protein
MGAFRCATRTQGNQRGKERSKVGAVTHARSRTEGWPRRITGRHSLWRKGELGARGRRRRTRVRGHVGGEGTRKALRGPTFILCSRVHTTSRVATAMAAR